MYFQHVYDKSLAQGSYFIGCQATGEAIVIDAQRDIDVYLEIAKHLLLKDQPEPPKYFAMMKQLNKVERALLLQAPKHPKLSVQEFQTAYANGIKVIDTRDNLNMPKDDLH